MLQSNFSDYIAKNAWMGQRIKEGHPTTEIHLRKKWCPEWHCQGNWQQLVDWWGRRKVKMFKMLKSLVEYMQKCTQ